MSRALPPTVPRRSRLQQSPQPLHSHAAGNHSAQQSSTPNDNSGDIVDRSSTWGSRTYLDDADDCSGQSVSDTSSVASAGDAADSSSCGFNTGSCHEHHITNNSLYGNTDGPLASTASAVAPAPATAAKAGLEGTRQALPDVDAMSEAWYGEPHNAKSGVEAVVGRQHAQQLLE